MAEAERLFGDDELDELLELSDEESASLRESAGEPEPEPEKDSEEAGAETAESATEEEAPASEEASSEEEPEPVGDEERSRYTEMEQRLKHLEGVERELYRERARRREAEKLAQQVTQPQDGGGIELTEDDFEERDGKIVVRPEALTRHMQAHQTPQQQFATQYSAMRQEYLSGVPEPERAAAGSAIDSLEEAYTWLDAKLGEVAKNYPAGWRLGSIGELRKTMDVEGITPEFEKRYPGVIVEEMMFGASDPYLFGKTVRSYMNHREKESGGDDAARQAERERQEDSRRTIALGQRPRSMTRRGTGARAGKKTAEEFANVSAEDLFTMSDEEFREMEAAAKAQ